MCIDRLLDAHRQRSLNLNGLDFSALRDNVSDLHVIAQSGLLLINKANLTPSLRDDLTQLEVLRISKYSQMGMLLTNALVVQLDNSSGDSSSESEEEEEEVEILAAAAPSQSTTAIQKLYESMAQADGQGLVVSIGAFVKMSSGPDHAKRFSCTLDVNGMVHTSPGEFPTVKAAKQAVALVAVNHLGLVM